MCIRLVSLDSERSEANYWFLPWCVNFFFTACEQLFDQKSRPDIENFIKELSRRTQEVIFFFFFVSLFP